VFYASQTFLCRFYWLLFLHIRSYVSSYWLLLFCTYVLMLVCNRRTTNVVWWWRWYLDTTIACSHSIVESDFITRMLFRDSHWYLYLFFIQLLQLFTCVLSSINKVDVLHVRLTELDAAHQNLPCYLLTYYKLRSPLFPTVLTLRGGANTRNSG